MWIVSDHIAKGTASKQREIKLILFFQHNLLEYLAGQKGGQRDMVLFGKMRQSSTRNKITPATPPAKKTPHGLGREAYRLRLHQIHSPGKLYGSAGFKEGKKAYRCTCDSQNKTTIFFMLQTQSSLPLLMRFNCCRNALIDFLKSTVFAAIAQSPAAPSCACQVLAE